MDASADSPEESLIRNENSHLLHAALLNITCQEREVLVGRFGLDGENGMTLREIGSSMGLSRERVRQIENQAKRKIRRFFERYTCSSEPPWIADENCSGSRRLAFGRNRRI